MSAIEEDEGPVSYSWAAPSVVIYRDYRSIGRHVLIGGDRSATVQNTGRTWTVEITRQDGYRTRIPHGVYKTEKHAIESATKLVQ